ncbi:MAG: SpoVR family protein [Deltaproteobacteria bacterium]|nr:MAG: SpoVR family protein [Deltaproteobacteria bacterium]
MQLIDQHTKKIMEGCKERAREVGLRFEDETLEYIVTNRDLVELGPKMMIPTLYDYWVHDVEVLKQKGRYELYPHNPYETVINTRPAISFYNDNNPDWLNVMIFYHVIAHIDFFQNNILFSHTWSEDFLGKALSDKRLIASLRSEKGRWVDYVIEFTRSIDNLVGFHDELTKNEVSEQIKASPKVDFYFDVFLQKVQRVKPPEYLKEIERYNMTKRAYHELAESIFFSRVIKEHPEFDALYEKHKKKKKIEKQDLIQFIQDNSTFLKKEENKWMRSVMQIVRDTSLFFQPQIRTKIMNEGWASYWHEKLFLNDERIKGHEVDFARINAGVTALSRIGVNPYAIGLRLFSYIEEMADRGKLSYDYQRVADIELRRHYNQKTGKGISTIFGVRENYDDFRFIHSFVDQEFVDKHRLFVAGRRLNRQKGVWEIYVKSRNADAYREMLESLLYHPPDIWLDESKMTDGSLYLTHKFEGKPLVKEFIPNTMMGIEYLWGAPVKLETTEIVEDMMESSQSSMWRYWGNLAIKQEPEPLKEPKYQRILYTMKERKLSKKILGEVSHK